MSVLGVYLILQLCLCVTLGCSQTVVVSSGNIDQTYILPDEVCLQT